MKKVGSCWPLLGFDGVKSAFTCAGMNFRGQTADHNPLEVGFCFPLRSLGAVIFAHMDACTHMHMTVRAKTPCTSNCTAIGSDNVHKTPPHIQNSDLRGKVYLSTSEKFIPVTCFYICM